MILCKKNLVSKEVFILDASHEMSNRIHLNNFVNPGYTVL